MIEQKDIVGNILMPGDIICFGRSTGNSRADGVALGIVKKINPQSVRVVYFPRGSNHPRELNIIRPRDRIFRVSWNDPSTAYLHRLVVELEKKD